MKDMMSFGIIAILVALVAAIAYFGNKQISALADKVRQLSNDVQALQRNLQALSERGPPPQYVGEVDMRQMPDGLPVPPYNPDGPSLPMGADGMMMTPMDDNVVNDVLNGGAHEAENVVPEDDEPDEDGATGGIPLDSTEPTEPTDGEETENTDAEDVFPTAEEMMNAKDTVSTSKLKKPKKKRVPSTPPSEFDEGHIEVSEFNGKKYVVVLNSRGHKRWHTVREDEDKTETTDANDETEDKGAEDVDKVGDEEGDEEGDEDGEEDGEEDEDGDEDDAVVAEA